MNQIEEISLGNMNDVEAVVNHHEEDSNAQNQPPGERAGQKPYTRIETTEIQRAVHFRSLGEHWKSLPSVSKLFMFMTLIDVFMVVGYVIWQSVEMVDDEGDGARKEEHLHVILGMFITAMFLVVFVLEAIYKENDFELTACLLLVTVIATRVIYFVTTAGYDTFPQVLAIAIVSAETIITYLLGLLTYNRFGWRIYSQLACDLRVKNATERTIIYFAENRFATLIKLDFQFLVLTTITGIVMSFQDEDLSIAKEESTRFLFICTVAGFLVGLPWIIASYCCVRAENHAWGRILGYLCPLTFPFPIAAVVTSAPINLFDSFTDCLCLVVYASSNRQERDANESLAISTALLIICRLAALFYMNKLISVSETKNDRATKKDIAEKSEFRLQFRMTNKHPDLLPLLKGAWLMKQSAQNQYRRRFFQLSHDFTTLRWAWNSYVVLFYVEEMIMDDDNNILTLKFEMEPDLVMKFETEMDYVLWKRGFEKVLPILLAPDHNIDEHSHTINENRHRRNKDHHGLKIESFLNVIGIRFTTRQHVLGLGSAHPLREAEKEWKRRAGSKNQHTASTSGTSDDKLVRQPTDASLNPQSSRIPTAKNIQHTGSSQSEATEHPTGDSQGDYDYNSTDIITDENEESVASVQALLGSMPFRVDTVDYNELQLGKFLGAGAEGAVYAAWYNDTPVAVKQTNSVHELEMTLCTGQHDNVVGLRGLAREGSATYLILEYCPRGTLDLLLHHTMNAGRWETSKVFSMIRCVARGLLHLHTRKPAVLHRDIKPANIFVSHGLVLKLGDFGMSRQLKPMAENKDGTPPRCRLRRTLTPNVIGTANYSAPELLDERLQSSDYDIDRILKADVYSFGVTVWEIVQRDRPFEGMQLYEIVNEWATGDGIKLAPFDIPKDLKPEDQQRMQGLQSLMFECTQKNIDMYSHRIFPFANERWTVGAGGRV